MSEEDGPDRRALLRAASGTVICAAGAALLSGCGGGGPAQQAAQTLSAPKRHRDIQLLSGALYLERRTVYAYTATIPLLTRLQAKAVKQFLNEELQHTGELIGLIKAAGGSFPQRAPSYPIGHPRTREEVLALLHELERQQVALYLRLIPRLASPAVRAAVASVLADDAQHLAIMRLERGLDPQPEAMVSGRE